MNILAAGASARAAPSAAAMYLLPQTPAQAVASRRCFARLKPTADQLTAFQKQLTELHRHLDPTQRKKHGEKHISTFLERADEAPVHPDAPVRYGNSKGDRDLVLHFGDTAASPVGLIMEVKGSKNTREMLAPDGPQPARPFRGQCFYLQDQAANGGRAEPPHRLEMAPGGTSLMPATSCACSWPTRRFTSNKFKQGPAECQNRLLLRPRGRQARARPGRGCNAP
ncbi:MAG: hypothetical protein WKG07_15840 [Hymenobacter sp.]